MTSPATSSAAEQLRDAFAELDHALTQLDRSLTQLDRTLLITARADLDEAELIQAIENAERSKNALAATQATLTAHFDTTQRWREQDHGVAAERAGRGVAMEVGLARGESHHRAKTLVSAAKILTREMPLTLRAWRRGHLTEHRAIIAVHETACLSREDRARIDAELATLVQNEAVGTRKLQGFLRRRACQLDPASVVRRNAKAEADRHVTIRPAPDQMVWLTALLPLTAGVACYAALTKATDSARASGDPRTRGQVMADTLIGRVTGRSPTQPCDIEIQVMVSDASLLAASDEPVTITGHGPAPASWLRHLITTATNEEALHLRRLFAAPGNTIATESTARCFPAGLANLIRARDQRCRTPYCDAPIRHADHVIPYTQGGGTELANGQGLCQACNHARQAPGWRSLVEGQRITTITPNGHHKSTRHHPTRADTSPRVCPASESTSSPHCGGSDGPGQHNSPAPKGPELMLMTT